MFHKKQQPTLGRQRPLAKTETRNSAVFSYHANRAVRSAGDTFKRNINAAQTQPDSHGAAAARRGSGWRRQRALTVALVAAGVLLVSSLFVGTSPHLVHVDTAGGDIFLRNQNAYQQAAQDELASSVLNRTKLTINTDRIAKRLADQFPELAHVAVTLPVFGHTVDVRIEPATPALILSITGGQSYILDTTGRALLTPAQAPGVGKLGLPVVADQSGLPINPGHVVLPSDSVQFIAEVTGQLQAAHINMTSLTLPKGTSELDVRLGGVPYFVKFNVQGDARAEAGTFIAVKQQLDRDKKTPGTYVDVRTDGRAYYK